MRSPIRSDTAATSSAAFVQVSDTEWRLSEYLTPRRRQKLQYSPSYDQLIDRLQRQMAVVEVARERSRDVPGFFRAVVALRVRASALDLFYNGASGYRAQ